jgi:hypothetical protein
MFMTLDRLQRLNFIKKMSFSLIFIIITLIIFVGIVDRTIIHLSFVEPNTRTSLFINNIFLGVVLFSIITQSIFFYKVYSESLPIKKGRFKIAYLVPLICHCLNLVLMTILMTQIYQDSRYDKSLILVTIWINTSIGISILAVLSYRFIMWLKQSRRKNIVILSYVASILLFIILNINILLYFSLGYRVGFPYITPTTNPSNIFSSPYDFLAETITNLTILSFIILWISSILLLIRGSEKLKKKYILVIGSSVVIFFSSYIFLWAFSSLKFSDFSLFHDIYTITSKMGFPLAGIFFGFTFWILAKNLDVLKDSNRDYDSQIRNVKQAMYYTSIGIILLIFSASPLDITILPYPPFGLISFSFMNLGALSFSLGIYNLATTISTSSQVRLGLKKKSDFLYSIGQSQDQLSKRNNIVGVLKEFKDYIIDTEAPQDLDKEYIKEVVTERSKSMNVLRKITFSKSESPLGRTWETYIESWCKWYYSVLGEHSTREDKSNDNWSDDKENPELCYLTKTIIKEHEKMIKNEFTIPKGRILFVPLINNLISFYDYPNLESEHDLRLFAKSDLDKKIIGFLSINDHEIKNILQYRVQSHLFDISLPEINDPSQKIKTQAIADGYWIFLHSLRTGANKIYFKVETSLGESPSEENADILEKHRFVTEVWYNLNITDN